MASKIVLSHNFVGGGFWVLLRGSPRLGKISLINDHNVSNANPSIRVVASKATISASEDEWLTAPCFLHIQDIGTKVRGPMMAKYPPVVLLLSRSESAKLASAHCPI